MKTVYLPYTITCRKQELFYDIDSILHKKMDIETTKEGGRENMQAYAIRTDDSELDRDLLTRMLDLRDAEVRTFMRRYLAPAETPSEENDMPTEDGQDYVYALSMPEKWRPAMLEPLTRFIHDYLVYGALWGYYRNNVPEWMRTIDLKGLEEGIKGLLNSRTGAVKRPLQPF